MERETFFNSDVMEYRKRQDEKAKEKEEETKEKVARLLSESIS